MVATSAHGWHDRAVTAVATSSREQLLDRVREALESERVDQALLSHPETVAHLSGYSDPAEDWPVANPFVGGPSLLAVTPSSATLAIADFYAAHAAAASVPHVAYRSYDVASPPDPAGELARVLDDLGLEPGRLGVEAGFLPTRVADALRARSFELVAVDELVIEARRRKLPVEIEAIRRASELADVVQQAVKENAEPGIGEAELAGLAQAAMYRAAGRRVPAILFVTAGERTGDGGAEASGNRLAPGDLVLTDTSPWLEGAWSDTASAVVVGEPTREQQRLFDAIRRALELAIDLCRPGAIASDVDRKVRESLADWDGVYAHHTGHGIGASWSEEPRIVPYNDRRIEEEMVIAVEPGVYRPGWGGIRLEDVFVVRAGGNELLTHYEHGLS
jgi:Xaa-Pro aminopeptidase